MSSSTSQLQSSKTLITANTSIYSPVILKDHEAVAEDGPGGHTISRHIGKDMTYLLSRFPKLRVASTFTDLSVAELSATEWFKAFLQELTGWYNDINRTEVKFSREIDITQDVGTYVKRDDPSNIFNAKKINLVVKVAQFNGMPHFILTAFPIEG